MRHQATYSRAVFVCSGIYQGLGFRDLTEVREYVADACWRHRRRCGGTTFFWKDVFPWIYHGLSIEYLLYLCLFIHLFIYLLCCIIRMYSFASWDGTVGGLCLKCVCVCVLAWTTPKAKWEPIGKQFGSAVFTCGFGVSKSETTLRKNSVIMMFSTCFFLRLTSAESGS